MKPRKRDDQRRSPLHDVPGSDERVGIVLDQHVDVDRPQIGAFRIAREQFLVESFGAFLVAVFEF